MKLYDLSGIWTVTVPGLAPAEVHIPGSLDENHVGFPDQERIATRLTRCCTYEGPAAFTTELHLPERTGRYFFEVERSRVLSLTVNGHSVEPYHPGTITTPWVFEVTDFLQEDNEITATCDNSYPGCPHDAIVYSSAATDETQTNWNGLLGYVRLRQEPEVFIDDLLIYPQGHTAAVTICVDSLVSDTVEVTLTGSALDTPVTVQEKLLAGKNEVVLTDIAFSPDLPYWDEYDSHLMTLKATIGEASYEITTGLRDFSYNAAGRLTLNDRVIFIRSEANCCEFPETGHHPMTVDEWIDVLKTYKSYGINCMRFHSHCPPDAAFTAADQLGMLMQPELSHWNPKTAFEDDLSYAYYYKEAFEIQRFYNRHPSFVMLTFGNELAAGDLGHSRMQELIRQLRAKDSTRLYADGSNVHYGQIGPEMEADFYASQKFFAKDLRGTFAGMEGFINNEYPTASHDYSDTMKELRKVYSRPVFSFEVGQFEVLPDFDEIQDFKGVRLPVNLEIIREKVQELGLEPVWKQYVEATGEISALAYREEIEAVLRTPEMSGISLLGLQDFTGQGTALVGMLNSHLQPKPFAFAKPERFHQFFNDQVLLAYLPKYTYTCGETLIAPVMLANYGKAAVCGALQWKLGTAAQGSASSMGSKNSMGSKRSIGPLMEGSYDNGGLQEIGTLEIPLESCGRLDLELTLGELTTTYPLWVYPEEAPVDPESIVVTGSLEEAQDALRDGKKVFLTPKADADTLPGSIKNQFTSDFWSVGTFPFQEGGMGLLIDDQHPALAEFPTDTHTNWQWWQPSSGRAVFVPKELTSIVTVMDSYAKLRPMSALFEARVGNGKLMFSSMGLAEHLDKPEVKALWNSILRYMDSDDFAPTQELALSELQKMFTNE